MTDALPRISIVTPSFNQAAYLQDTIRSVLDQAYPNLQYGVVDGRSTDGTERVLERFGDRLDYTVVESDGGQTEAINKGLRRADGQIVGWLCSDDTLLPGALDAIGRHFAEHPEDDWIAGSCVTVDEAGQRVEAKRTIGDFTLSGVLLRNEQRPFNLPQPSVFWRRSLHERFGLIDETLHYCMDFEFWLRLLAAGIRPTLLERELATYRLHERSKSCAAPEGFLREHLHIERRYARLLPWRERLHVRRRLGYYQRALAARTTRSHLWSLVVRHPWWLASQQIRNAIRNGPSEPARRKARRRKAA